MLFFFALIQFNTLISGWSSNQSRTIRALWMELLSWTKTIWSISSAGYLSLTEGKRTRSKMPIYAFVLNLRGVIWTSSPGPVLLIHPQYPKLIRPLARFGRKFSMWYLVLFLLHNTRLGVSVDVEKFVSSVKITDDQSLSKFVGQKSNRAWACSGVNSIFLAGVRHASRAIAYVNDVEWWMCCRPSEAVLLLTPN